jgi:hypothetical protein
MAKKDVKAPKRILGRKDKFDFPELGLEDIETKVDTGADTSAMNCHNIQTFEKDGREWVRFVLPGSTLPAYKGKKIEMPVHRKAYIKSSNSQRELRIIIKTTAVIFGNTTGIELSLTDRSEMKYPVLLGRKVLAGRYLVDVSLYDMSFKFTKRQNG